MRSLPRRRLSGRSRVWDVERSTSWSRFEGLSPLSGTLPGHRPMSPTSLLHSSLSTHRPPPECPVSFSKPKGDFPCPWCSGRLIPHPVGPVHKCPRETDGSPLIRLPTPSSPPTDPRSHKCVHSLRPRVSLTGHVHPFHHPGRGVPSTPDDLNDDLTYLSLPPSPYRSPRHVSGPRADTPRNTSLVSFP